MGRPSSFTQEVADSICEAIAESDYGLEQICEDERFPDKSTIYRWLDANESFRDQYARAKLRQADTQAWRGTKEALTASDAGLGRLKWDARRWNAAKLYPKVYGDKQEVAHTGQVSIQAVLQDERI